ncbi:MAG: hypothetical protein SNJ64_05215, partial [Endomicrobiia bacterium]
NNINCPHCKKNLYQSNIFYIDKTTILSKGSIFKNITIFFVSDRGEIVIKCKGCGKITKVPFCIEIKQSNLLSL